MEYGNIARETSAGKLEFIPAVVLVAFVALGPTAAVASAATPLPVRVPLPNLPDSPEARTTGWDIDGDGRPDMIQVQRGGAAQGSIETAYDFDGDGKPDFVRSGDGPHSQRERSTGPSPLR